MSCLRVFTYVRFAVPMLCLAIGVTACAAERQLPIPKWFPVEPGAELEYRSKDGVNRYTAIVKVREVTHTQTAYSMSALVSVRSDDGSVDQEGELNFFFEQGNLTVSLPWGAKVEFSKVPLEAQIGDVIQVLDVSQKAEELAGKEQSEALSLKVFSVGTKVAINKTKWDDAIVLGCKYQAGEMRLTLASPDGLVRFVFQTRDGSGAVCELVPPRTPFDK